MTHINLQHKNMNLEQRLERIEKMLEAQNIINKKVLNIDELAQYTRMSKPYLYKLTCKNKIPYSKPNGKTLFFDKEEIDTWLLTNRQATKDELRNEAEQYALSLKRKSSI